MIVDCHTHLWESPEQLGPSDGTRSRPVLAWMRGSRGGDGWPPASIDLHLASRGPVDKSLVLGFKSRYLGAEIPASMISRHVKAHPGKLIGVAGIDPTNLGEALDDLAAAAEELGMKAITVSPAAQDFHPADSRAMQVFAEAARRGMPVIFEQGIHFSSASKMEFARPSLLDEVARELPRLRIVVSYLGYPWTEECLVLLGKHEHVYADISSLLARPWQAYDALLKAYHYGVIERLLFASGFPYASAPSAIESLYRLNQLVTGTNLPTIPRTHLTAIVERDALGLLGIEPAASVPPSERRDVPDAHDA